MIIILMIITSIFVVIIATNAIITITLSAPAPLQRPVLRVFDSPQLSQIVKLINSTVETLTAKTINRIVSLVQNSGEFQWIHMDTFVNGAVQRNVTRSK